jgi:hypothetical protein
MTSMIQVARMGQADVEAAAEILFEAFGSVYRRRGHNPPFPTLDSAAWLCRAYLDLDPEGCLVAWSGARLVGVGFAHPRGGVTSIGPLAARPGAPAGVARALMRQLGASAPGSTTFRLFQDAFNPDSFGLYTRLGYVVADVAPYLLADRLEPAPTAPPAAIRPLRTDDLAAVERYDRARTGARISRCSPRAAARSWRRPPPAAAPSAATSSIARSPRELSSARGSPSRRRRSPPWSTRWPPRCRAAPR